MDKISELSEVIGIDEANELIRLQSYLVEQVQGGQISLDDFKWWLMLDPHNRRCLREEHHPTVPCYTAENGELLPVADDLWDNFILVKDLGWLIVPTNFNHLILGYPFENHYPKPSYVLKPGDRLRVRVFRQDVMHRPDNEQRMMFCEVQPRNVWVGAQVMDLILDQKASQLPDKDWRLEDHTFKHILSFDWRNRLYLSKNHYLLPWVRKGCPASKGVLGYCDFDEPDPADAFFQFSLVR